MSQKLKQALRTNFKSKVATMKRLSKKHGTVPDPVAMYIMVINDLSHDVSRELDNIKNELRAKGHDIPFF